jgi:hypothetical protein
MVLQPAHRLLHKILQRPPTIRDMELRTLREFGGPASRCGFSPLGSSMLTPPWKPRHQHVSNGHRIASAKVPPPILAASEPCSTSSNATDTNILVVTATLRPPNRWHAVLRFRAVGRLRASLVPLPRRPMIS